MYACNLPRPAGLLQISAAINGMAPRRKMRGFFYILQIATPSNRTHIKIRDIPSQIPTSALTDNWKIKFIILFGLSLNKNRFAPGYTRLEHSLPYGICR